MNLEVFIEEVANEIIKKYKADFPAVYSNLKDGLEKSPQLVSKIESSPSSKEVKRYREYKDFIKRMKKDTYYSLRKYHTANDDSLQGEVEHISTKERSSHLDSFYAPIFKTYSNVETILDIGGGVFPLTFPFEKFPKLKHYVWIDRDAKSFDTLSKLNNPKLKLYNHSIGEQPWNYYLPEGVGKFDLALMIKLVSVISRQERELLETLATVPAQTILVTAPKEAMTKKESIERRERSVIRNFINLTGRDVVGELDIENEFGYFLDNV